MSYSIEFFSAVLFFAGLIVIYNLRSLIETDNKLSFRYITIGLSTMSLCSAASVLAQQNVFSQIPLLNIPLFFQLFYWIGMITGLTLLLSGVSNWMPVYRKNLKYNTFEINKLELFKKIEQLIRFENRNNVVLFQSLELILKQYNFNEVGCFLFSQQKKEMVFLGAVDNENNNSIKSHLIQFDNEAILKTLHAQNLELIYHIDDSMSSPDLLLPMQVDNKLLGLFCFYSDDEIEKQSVSNLQLIIEILSTKLIEDSKTLKHELIVSQNRWIQKIKSAIDSTKTVKDSIAACRKLLQEKLPVDFLTVSFPYREKIIKYSISTNNQVLEDLTYSFTNKNELEQYVLNNNLPVTIENLDIETDFIVDITALQIDIKSMIAFPISNVNGQIGVVVVGSKKYKAYSKVSLQHVELMHTSLERLIVNSLQKMHDKSESLRRNSLKKILRSAVRNINSTSFYQNLSDNIANELNASIVRISLYDSDKRFLNSQVMSTSDDSLFVTPDDATMMLTIMPNHRRVLQIRETITVEKNSSNSDDFILEQRQIFGDTLSQMIIIPFYYGSTIIGVITVGQAISKMKMTDSDILFVEDAASILTIHNHFMKQAAYLKKMKSQLQKRKNIDKQSQHPLQNLKSSLTGIIGSVELMKEAKPQDEKIEKYISLLDKSAQRMTKVFQEELVGE